MATGSRSASPTARARMPAPVTGSSTAVIPRAALGCWPGGTIRPSQMWATRLGATDPLNWTGAARHRQRRRHRHAHRARHHRRHRQLDRDLVCQAARRAAATPRSGATHDPGPTRTSTRWAWRSRITGVSGDHRQLLADRPTPRMLWRSSTTGNSTATPPTRSDPRTAPPQGGAAYAPGQFGQAVSLDGVDDYISTATAGNAGHARHRLHPDGLGLLGRGEWQPRLHRRRAELGHRRRGLHHGQERGRHRPDPLPQPAAQRRAGELDHRVAGQHDLDGNLAPRGLHGGQHATARRSTSMDRRSARIRPARPTRPRPPCSTSATTPRPARRTPSTA